MGRKKCPDCDGEDFNSIHSKGNGDCKHCHGKGSVHDIGDALTEIATFGSVESETECKVCSGTGQCQTCGGEGYIYGDDGFEEEDDDYYDSGVTGSGGGQSYSSGGGSSGEGYYSPSTDYGSSGSENSERGYGRVLITIVIIIALAIGGYVIVKIGDKPESDSQPSTRQHYSPPSQQHGQPVLGPIPDNPATYPNEQQIENDAENYDGQPVHDKEKTDSALNSNGGDPIVLDITNFSNEAIQPTSLISVSDAQGNLIKLSDYNGGGHCGSARTYRKIKEGNNMLILKQQWSYTQQSKSEHFIVQFVAVDDHDESRIIKEFPKSNVILRAGTSDFVLTFNFDVSDISTRDVLLKLRYFQANGTFSGREESVGCFRLLPSQ